MKWTDIITTPRRRPAGVPPSPKFHLVALEYILWPGKRPRGLIKELAYSNDFSPNALSDLVRRIKCAANTVPTKARRRGVSRRSYLAALHGKSQTQKEAA